jgi:dTDP-4-dehydrorhamnose reductase
MFLVIGGDSEIGSAVYRTMRAAGKSVIATTRRSQPSADRLHLDLAASLAGWQPPPGAGSACTCAAVARLADCAADPEGSAHINVVQTAALADKLLQRGVHVLFLSTNQVFEGTGPHTAADAPHAPVSEYGRQKARMETLLLRRIAGGEPVAILRLAKVVSPRMPLFDEWIKKLSAGQPIRAFTDMTLAPTPIGVVCDAISRLMADRATGVFQLTGPRDVTYAEAARYLAVRLGVDSALVREASVREAGLPHGTAPPYTSLDSTLLRQRYGIDVPDPWRVVDWLVSTIDETATAGSASGAVPAAGHY